MHLIIAMKNLYLLSIIFICLMPCVILLCSPSKGSHVEVDEETRLFSRNHPDRSITYQVALVYRDCSDKDPCEDDQYKVFVCSGGIITVRAVLTSASCFFHDSRLKTYSVRAGYNWRDEYIPLKISKVVYHDSFSDAKPWDSKSSQFVDLAVVLLKNPIRRYMQILSLPTAQQFCRTREFDVAGWAKQRVKQYYKYSSELIVDKYEIVTSVDCRKLVNKPWNKPFFDVSYDHHVCVKGTPLEGGPDTECLENLGGPLVKDGVIYGVFSFVKEDCSDVQPAVYTKVSPFTTWIREVAKNNDDYDNTVILYE